MAKQKRKLPRWVVYIIIFFASFLLIIPAIPLLNANKDSFFGIVLAMGFVFGSHFAIIALIVYVVKAIVKKVTSKKEKPKVVSYQEIKYPGEVGNNGQTPLKSFTYNTDDTLRLNPEAPALSWGYIALFLVILFPVGVFFLIRKVMHEKTQYYDNGVKMIVMGVLSMVLTVPLILLIIITGADSARALIIVNAIPGMYALFGAVSVVLGVRFKQKGKQWNAYMKAIVNDKITNIDMLAKMAKTTYSGAVDVIQKLIDSRLLEGAYIYHRDREVIVPGVSKKIAFRCKYCGGTTVQYANDEKECVYCGAKNEE